MKWTPLNLIDSGLLFYPQLCDNHWKLTILINWSKWIGLFWCGLISDFHYIWTLNVIRGRIILNWGWSRNFSHLSFNINLNTPVQNIQLLNVGFLIKLKYSLWVLVQYGNTSGNSFLSKSATRVDVDVDLWKNIVIDLGIDKNWSYKNWHWRFWI